MSTRFDRCVVLLAAVSLLVAGGCGSGSKDAAPAATPTPSVVAQNPAVAVEKTPAPLNAQLNQSAKSVAFEELVALLPEAAGWTRSKPRGEQITMGVEMSRAEAEYDKGDSSIDLDITDSAFNQVLLAPLATYLAKGYSERSNEGYRKAAPIGGHPALETWNSDSRRAEVTVVVGNRFVVQAVGHNVDGAGPVRALAQAVDFGRLAALK